MSVSGVHCAYNVLFAVGVYDAFPSAILFPPVAASYHPLNVYPVRVGTGVVTFPAVQSGGRPLQCTDPRPAPADQHSPDHPRDCPHQHLFPDT